LVIVTLRKILLAVGKPAGFPYHPIPLIWGGGLGWVLAFYTYLEIEICCFF
jgi:hypothetical protein